ncbi:hypothetical protein OG21DRAFT_1206933 [Imleria badia]|nr:hypothetical protein OG21DRAFT_1206933 [Imleria badia]
MDERRISASGTIRHNNPLIPPTGSSCPIHKLPSETLACIFEHVADSLHVSTTADLEDITGEVYAEPQESPNYKAPRPNGVELWFPVTLVCRNWHDVAFSTPSLWAAITIGPYDPLPLDRFEEQLYLSKSVPIDFQISLLDSCWHARSDYPRVCSLLIPHAYRWRSLEARADLAMNMHTVLDAFFKNRIQIPSQLTSVTLVCDEETSYLPASESFGLSAPHLKTLRLLGVSVDWKTAWISSACNLTTLHIRANSLLSWTQISTLLRRAPRLEVLILQSKLSESSHSWADSKIESMFGYRNTNPIKLLELRQLVIILSAGMATHLLRGCYIPALRKLTLGSQHWSVEPVEVIAQLAVPQAVIDTSLMQVQLSTTPEQSRSMLAGLDYLCLDRFDCYSKTLRSLYSNLNRFTSLVIRVYSPGGYALHPSIDFLFRLSTSCAILLPQLKTLSIHSYKRYWDHHVGRICKLAWHRHDIGVPLRALTVRSLSPKAEIKQDLDWLWCSDSKNLETFYVKEY